MRNASSWLLPLLLVCGAGLAVWILWAPTGPGGGAPALEPAWGTHPEAAPTGPTLHASARSAPEVRSGIHSRIEGVVVRSGAPVAARIQVFRLGSFHAARDTWTEDPEAWRNAARPFHGGRPLREVASDATGRFQVEGLSGGLYRLVADVAGVRGSCRACFLEPDGRTMVVRIALAAGSAPLQGRVLHADGTPWRGRVHVTPTHDRTWWSAPMPGDAPGVQTDAQGRFEVPHAPYGPVRAHAIDAQGVRTLSRRIWIPHQKELEIRVAAPDSWVDVRVVSADDGTPIAHAEVLAAGYSDRPQEDVFLATHTDTDGRARVPMGGNYVSVRVEAGGWTRADTRVPHGEDSCHISLTRASMLRGVVRALADGAPVVGMTILAWKGPSATTGPDGRFELPGVPAGDTPLYGRGDGWRAYGLEGAGESDWWVYPVPGRTHDVSLVAWRAASWRGRIVDAEGQPVAGATATAHARDGDDDLDSEVVASGISDETGAVTVAGIPVGKWHAVCVQAPGFALAVSEPFRSERLDDPPRHEIRMSAGRLVDVEVRDERGQPLPGVRIAIKAGEPRWTYRVTDVDGRATVEGLSDAELHLWARCEGYAVLHRTIAAAAPGAGPPPLLTLTLGGAGSILGHVRWADGSPVVETKVEIDALDKTAWTDAQGAFRFEWVPAGEHILQCKATHVDPEEVVTLPARFGDRDIVLAFEAGPPPEAERTRIEVRGPDGLPVAAASVTTWHGDSRNNERVRSGKAEVPAGWTRLRVHDASSSTTAPLPLGPLVLGPHDGSTRVVLTLPPELMVSGVVESEAGVPVGGVRITARGEDDTEEEVRSDASGTFRIGRLPPGPLVLQAESLPGLLSNELRTQAGTHDLVLRLRQEAPVELRVVDVSGEAVAGAHVRWVRVSSPAFDDQTEGDLTTDAAGRGRLHGLDPEATYTLWISPPEERDLLERSWAAWTPSSGDLALPPSYRIEGRIVDPEGHPVPSMQVWGLREDSDTASAISDDQGRFVLGGLEPGRVRVVVKRQNWPSERWGDENTPNPMLSAVSAEERVVAAGTRGLRIEVDVGLPLRIRVRGWDPKADGAARAHLIAETPVPGEDPNQPGGRTAEGRPWFDAAANEAGHFHFAQARPDARFTLWIGPLSGGRFVRQTGLRGRREAYVVSAQAGGTLRGTVHAPADVRPTRIRVSGPGFFADATPDENGDFEVAGLPPGPVTVVAYGEGRSDGMEDDPWAGFVQSEDWRARAAGRVGSHVTLHLEKDE